MHIKIYNKHLGMVGKWEGEKKIELNGWIHLYHTDSSFQRLSNKRLKTDNHSFFLFFPETWLPLRSLIFMKLLQISSIFKKAHIQPLLCCFQFHKHSLLISWPHAFSKTKQRETELLNPITVQRAFTQNMKWFVFYICNKQREKRMKYILLVFV